MKPGVIEKAFLLSAILLMASPLAAQNTFQQGDLDRAIAGYSQAIQSSPKNVYAWIGRAEAYYNKGDYRRAISDLTQALRLDPRNGDAFFMRGLALRANGECDRAIPDLDVAIKIKPSGVAYHNRGKCYHELRDHKRAIIDLTFAVQYDPKNAKAYYDRGLARKAVGDTGADTDIERAKELDPSIGK